MNFNNYHITHDLHHLPVAYLLTVPVASVCKGSRTFRVGVDVYWSSGNPVKIDGGKVTYKRPMYAGNVFGYVQVTTPVQVVTARQSEFDPLAALLLGHRSTPPFLAVGEAVEEMGALARRHVEARRVVLAELEALEAVGGEGLAHQPLRAMELVKPRCRGWPVSCWRGGPQRSWR